ncbi:MAG: AraC family transcriptional regulator [Thermomicrobiales bacterium]
MERHVTSDLHRRQADRAELIDRLTQLLPETGILEPVPDAAAPGIGSDRTGHGTSFPSFCVIAQGAKELRLGDRRFTYDVDSYLIVSNTLPFASRVAEATAERPYLGVIITLDPALVSAVIADSGIEASARKPKSQRWTQRLSTTICSTRYFDWFACAIHRRRSRCSRR